MSQHDYNIANQSGLEFRQDLNNALSAIVTQNADTTAPTTTFAGMEWLDTTSNPPIKKRRNQANTAWENILTEQGRLLTSANDAAEQRIAMGVSLPAEFNSSAVASGTADALTASFTPAITSLPSSPSTLVVFVEAQNANTSTTPTFQADATTAKTIVKGANQPLSAGDISGVGHLLTLQYSPAIDKWVLQNPINTALPSQSGNSGKVLKTNGTTASWDSALNLGTVKNTTSGTSIDFSPTDGTGIPSWVKRITVMLNGVSASGTSILLIQLGDSGGIEPTGYLTAGGLGGAEAGQTIGFPLGRANAAASAYYGAMTLTLQDPTTNLWVQTNQFYQSNASQIVYGAGAKALSTTLDRIRLTTINGTDTFDAGSINILYE